MNKNIEKEKYIDAVLTIKQKKKLNEEAFYQVNCSIKDEYRLLDDLNYAVKGERIDRMIDEMDNDLRNITKKSFKRYEETLESLNKQLAKIKTKYEKIT